MVEKGRTGFNIMKKDDTAAWVIKGNELHGNNIKKKGGYVKE